MGYAVAAVVGGLLGGVEQYRMLRSPFTRADHALWWWTGRIGLEAGIGAAGLALLEALGASFHPALLFWIVAGAAGPAIARIRLIDLQRDDQSLPLGLAAAYEPLRNWIAGQIDDIGASALSRWVTEDLEPVLARTNTPAAEVVERLRVWITGSARFPASEEADQIAFLDRTLNDAQPNHVQRGALVQLALRLRANRVLRDLHNHCKRTP